MVRANRRLVRCGMMVALASVVALAVASDLRAADPDPVVVLTENFDGVVPRLLPDGWGQQFVAGYTGLWYTRAGSHAPNGYAAPSAPNLLNFNSTDADADDSSRVLRFLPLDLTRYRNLTLSFSMLHDSGESGANDRVQAQVSGDGGLTWENAGAAVSRYAVSTAWSSHTIDISAMDHGDNVCFALLGISDWGNDLNIDDLVISGIYCNVMPTQGTIGTRISILGSGFGTKAGTLRFGTDVAPWRASLWTDTSIDCTMTGPWAPGLYDVRIDPTIPAGAPTILYLNAFTVEEPQIATVLPVEGYARDTVTITGMYFCSKKGKVFLEYSDEGGAISAPCKVTSWTMDPDTGESRITFLVPTGLASHTYDVKVVNAVGEDISEDAYLVK